MSSMVRSRARRLAGTFPSAALVAIAMMAMSAVPALSRPGDLDTSFGGDGIASSDDFGGVARGGTDLLVQPDGKVLIVGSRGRTPTKNMAVWRLTADGLPDMTFSGDGIAVADFGGSDEGEELALMSDGRIVVVGTSFDAFGRLHLALAMLTSKGRLDTTFSGDGRVLRGGANESWGYGVAVDSADAIVVVGSRAYRFTLFRYTSGGAVDRSFGGTGVVDVPELSGNTFSNFPEDVDVTIQPDGRILGLGTHFVPPPAGQGDCGVARLMPDGEPDRSFSGDGLAYAGFPEGVACSGIVLSPVNAKITVAGSTGPGSMVLARFKAGGALDPNFDLDGRVITTLGVSAVRAWGVAREGTKTIAVGGTEPIRDDPDSMWVIARFTARGQLDTTTFGDGGRVFTNLYAGCCPLEAATSATVVDGKLVVGGMVGVGGGFGVARYAAGDV